MNSVIAGDYCGCSVIRGYGKSFYLMKHLAKNQFEKKDVFSYELVNNINNTSIWSTFIKGYIGHAVFGIPGLAAGVVSSMKNIEYLFAIDFSDGKKSLLSIDQQTYKYLLKVLF